MGKKGAVVYMRGIAGHPADTDRDTGFKKALAEYPDITVAKETVTKWDQKEAVSQINEIMSGGVKFDGIWTSGIDNVIVDALKTGQASVRADRRRRQRRVRPAAAERAGPQGRRGHQPVGRHRRRRRPRDPDPRGPEARPATRSM